MIPPEYARVHQTCSWGRRSWLGERRARHHPEPQTRGGQERIQRHTEAQVLVDWHVARREGEQPAGRPLGIDAGGHPAHESATDALSLMPRLDAEPCEMPVRF